MYSELGRMVREFLGRPAKFRTKESEQLKPRRTAVLLAENAGMFAEVPLAHFPPNPNLDRIVREANCIDEIYTIDDQRLVDVGVAAEYFLAHRAAFQHRVPNTPSPAPAASPSSSSS